MNTQTLTFVVAPEINADNAKALGAQDAREGRGNRVDCYTYTCTEWERRYVRGDYVYAYITTKESLA